MNLAGIDTGEAERNRNTVTLDLCENTAKPYYAKPNRS